MLFHDIFDLLLPPIYLLIIGIILAKIQTKKLNEGKSEYSYFMKGWIAKIIGAISLGIVYDLYYKGGDTYQYYLHGCLFSKLGQMRFQEYWDILIFGNKPEFLYYFDETTGFPNFSWTDSHALFVSRIISVFSFFGFRSYVTMSILIATISFFGIWKLYQLFIHYFPKLKKELGFAILFVPSVVFWGSGILKDTITLACVGWFTYYFHKTLIQKKIRVIYILAIFITSIFIIAIKPYVFFALGPGAIVWYNYNYITKFNNKTFKFIIGPMLLSIGIIGALIFLSYIEDYLGIYKIDTVLDRASVVQNDLKQEYYQGNSFDIGEFEPTVTGVISKAPQAIMASLFRPYLWDVKNPVMLISSLENTYILILTIFLLIKLKFIGFFRYIWLNPLLLFSILFSLFFAFSVGLTTSNFGALVRLKIQGIPFYVASIFIIRSFYQDEKTKHRTTPKAP